MGFSRGNILIISLTRLSYKGCPRVSAHKLLKGVQIALAKFYKITQILGFISFQTNPKRALYVKHMPRYSHLRKHSYGNSSKKIRTKKYENNAQFFC